MARVWDGRAQSSERIFILAIDLPERSVPECAPPIVVLASASPRRTYLLSEAGVPHLVRIPPVDDAECALPLAGASLVECLAHIKAHQVACGSGEVVVAADTLCLVDSSALGKPNNEREARAMILRLVSRPHQVVTGVSIRHGGCSKGFVEAAVVSLGHLGAGDLNDYLASGLWRGKAGAYDYPERLAAGWPLSCEGDPTTVSGLPMQRLLAELQMIGVPAAAKAGEAR